MPDTPGDDQEQLILRVELEDALSGEVRVVNTSLESLEKAMAEAERASKQLDDQNAETARGLVETGAAAKGGAKGVEEFGDEAAEAAIKSKMLEKQNKKTKRGMLGFLKFGLDFQKMFKAGRLFVIGDAIQFIVAGINGLGAAAIATVNGLAPLTGMLVAYPGLLAAGVQGMAAFKMGMHGMGNAMKVMLNPDSTVKEVTAAMKDLAPSARMVLITLQKFHKEWKGIRQETQEALWHGMAPLIKDLATRYLPILSRGMQKTARAINSDMQGLSKWLDDPKVAKKIDALMDSNADVVGNLGDAGRGGVRILLNLLVAARPVIRAMSRDLASMLNGLANKMNRNKGGLRDWLIGSYSLWKKTWKVAKDFGMGIFNIFKASAPLSHAMGKDITEVAANFREWTGDKGNQKIMRQWFRDMIPVVRELGSWITSIGQAWFSLNADPQGFIETSKLLRQDLLPALVNLANSMGGKFLPSLVKIIEAWANSPFATDAFAVVLSLMADGLTRIVDLISALPTGWQKTIGTMMALSFFVKMRPGAIIGRIFGGGKGGLFGGGGMLSGLLGGGKQGSIKKPIYVWVLNSGGGVPGGVPGSPTSKLGKFAKFASKVAVPVAIVAMSAIALNAFRKWNNDPKKNVVGNAMTGGKVGEWSRDFFGGDDDVKHSGAGGLLTGMLNKVSTAFRQAIYFKDAINKLPKAVQTQVRTPGLISTIEYVKILQDQYKLTPAQVKTVIGASGVAKTIKDVNKIAKMYDYTGHDVVTLIATNGIPITKRQIKELQREYGLTRKDVKTLATLNADQAFATIQRLRTAYSGMSKDIYNMTLDTRGMGGFRGGLPMYFAGGTPNPGVKSMVGEFGPEAAINRAGKMSIVGANGPEVKTFSPGTAIIPHTATADPFGGATGNAPDWAVRALQSAYSGSGGVGGRTPAGNAAQGGSKTEEHYHMHMPVQPVNSQLDVQEAMRRGWDKLQQEAKERQ